jgi:hypothetical protein
MTIYRILDDIEAGASRDRKRDRFRALFLRKGLPSTVCIHGGKEFVMLSPEWMQYVDRKSTRLNSSHYATQYLSRMPSSA